MEAGTPPLLTGSTSRLDCVIELFDSLMSQNRHCGKSSESVDSSSPSSNGATEDTLVAASEMTESELSEGGTQDLNAEDASSSSGSNNVQFDDSTSKLSRSALVRARVHDESEAETVDKIENRQTDLSEPDVSSSIDSKVGCLGEDGSEFLPDVIASTGTEGRRRKTGNVTMLKQAAAAVFQKASPIKNNSAEPMASVSEEATSEDTGSNPPDAASGLDTMDPSSTDSGMSESTGSSPSDLGGAPTSRDPSTASEGTADECRVAPLLSAPPPPALGWHRELSWPCSRGVLRWRASEPRPLSGISTTSSSSSSGAGSLPRTLVRRRTRQDSDVSDGRGPTAADSGSCLSYLSSSATSISSPTGASVAGLPGALDPMTPDPAMTPADRVVAEILQTEAVYVSDLQQVIQGYIVYLREYPERSIGDEQAADLFSNFEDIFLCNRDLLSSLEQCEVDPLRVAECFVSHQDRFSVYTEYCTNYPRSVSALTELMRRETTARLFRERQLALGHTLPLGSYLLKPVQRILKYHLLLQSLASQIASCSEVDRQAATIALQTMKRLADNINNMKRKHEHAVRVQEIQSLMRGWQGDDLTTYGELLAEDTFRVPRAKVPRHVFLFELMLLITKRQADNTLVYKTHIMCSNLMLIESVPGEANSLQVLPFDNPRLQYTLQARTVDRKRQWALRLKAAILESYGPDIPKHARELVMKLGQHRDNGEGLRRRIGKRYHSVPDYLERRRSVKRGPSMSGRSRRGEATPKTSREERERRGQIMFNYITRRSRWSVPNGPLQSPTGSAAGTPERPPLTPAAEGAPYRRSSCSDCPDWSAGPLSTSGSHCLPDLDEESADDTIAPSCAAADSLHFTAVVDDADVDDVDAEDRVSVDHVNTDTASVSSAGARASSTLDLDHETEPDLQSIVEQLVMQKKQFQRILDRPRRDLRRSETQSSSGSATSTSERDADSCLDLVVTTSPDDVSQESSDASTALVPTSGLEEVSREREVEPSCEVKRVEAISRSSVERKRSSGDLGSNRMICESSRLFICDALNIESRDNVEYVSLFNYGSTSTGTTPVPPPDVDARDSLPRSVAEPCRRVVRRFKDLRQAGGTEMRHLFRGIRNRSIRLSKHLEEERRGHKTTLSDPGTRDSSQGMLCVLDETDSERDCQSRLGFETESIKSRIDAESEQEDSVERNSDSKGSRPVWKCDILPDDDEEVKEQPSEPPDPAEIRRFAPHTEHQSVVRRRSASDRRINHWRPISLMFEPHKSHAKRPTTLLKHATSLERLNCRIPALDRHAFLNRSSCGVPSCYAPSLASLRSARVPTEGGVRWLGKRVLQLMLGDLPQPKARSVHALAERCSSGARLATAADPAALIGPLQSPLLTDARRQLMRTESVTSRGSSAESSESSEASEQDPACGFYEHDMDILETVDCLEVCW